jgi:hypothetical protein
MYRKIVIGGAAAAAVLGAGGAAFATTGSATAPNGGTSAHPGAAAHPPRHLRAPLRSAVHAQVVVRGKDGRFVTHDEIRGIVSAVSPTSISVRAADKTSETYVINSGTKVRVRTDGKARPGSPSSVHTGDRVIVLGVGASTRTARHIVDLGKR